MSVTPVQRAWRNVLPSFEGRIWSKKVVASIGYGLIALSVLGCGAPAERETARATPTQSPSRASSAAANSPTTTASPRPTASPATQARSTPAETLCGAPPNPWGYNFCGGTRISAPPAPFCNYFSCIPNFWNGRGAVIQCTDLMFSKSGGISGSCSSHRGNYRYLLAP
jgi:hypothetical protein